ncbi:hypothetical protein [Albidovulum aquaemixtae]|uniref:hypothetical protein n=1 Tax=Albidovulum aquaemixtae TaxID=1542388 RepID=UPI003F672D3E
MITLTQAAAKVIGMNIGTTFKSVLATLGGTRDMRRTAAALVAFHTLFNTIGALIMLPVATPFARLIELLIPGAGAPPHSTTSARTWQPIPTTSETSPPRSAFRKGSPQR